MPRTADKIRNPMDYPQLWHRTIEAALEREGEWFPIAKVHNSSTASKLRAFAKSFRMWPHAKSVMTARLQGKRIRFRKVNAVDPWLEVSIVPDDSTTLKNTLAAALGKP